MITILLFLALVGPLFAPGVILGYIPEAPAINPYLKAWYAVKMVESHNREDIINHTEGAYGPSQIRQIKLDEYNRVNGTNIKLSDCLKENTSRRIFMWHMMQYNDIETAVKRWNGSGPLTVIYYNKVKRYL